MFKDFAVFVVIVILITVNVNGSTRNTLATKRGANLPPRKNTKKMLRTNLTKINGTVRDNFSTVVRKTRTPQYLTLGQQNSLRLSPFALPYTSRFTGSMTPSSGLTLQQIQQLQQLKQLGRLRSFLPQERLNTALAPSSLTPYQLQLARILPLLNLYRTKSIFKENPGAGFPLYQPNRLKYDSIPLKPGFEGQALPDDRLSLLLGLGGLGANPYAAAKTEGGSVRSDMGDEGMKHSSQLEYLEFLVNSVHCYSQTRNIIDNTQRALEAPRAQMRQCYMYLHIKGDFLHIEGIYNENQTILREKKFYQNIISITQQGISLETFEFKFKYLC